MRALSAASRSRAILAGMEQTRIHRAIWVRRWRGRRPHALRIRRRVYRIFWVSTQSQPDPFLDGFREGLRARGYVEGKNLAFELHYAPGNPQALREVVSELRRGEGRSGRVERAGDARDDGGDGSSGAVCV